ncbi:hypothetical protein D7X74_15680 [Corallococcus sp. CA047B]|nr:hypothetical protein D7X74_15680 [Corallococcus sp. CA047B]
MQRSLDGWMAGWLDGWMAGWLDGWMAGWLDGWMAGWLDGWMAGWLDGWMAGWLDGWMAGDNAYACRQGSKRVLSNPHEGASRRSRRAVIANQMKASLEAGFCS